MYEQFDWTTSLILEMIFNETPYIYFAKLNTTIKLNTLSEKIAAGNKNQKKKKPKKKNQRKKTQKTNKTKQKRERLKRVLKLKEMCGTKGKAKLVAYD